MDYRAQIRQYVTQKWNYSDGMVDGFDDYDYEIVKDTIGFRTWLVNQELKNINPFVKIVYFFKRIFK